MMNDYIRRRYDAAKRGKQFGDDHALVPANAVATAAYTALGGSISTIEALASGRLNGTSTFRGAVAERRFLRDELRGTVSDLSRISKTLDKTTYPDIAAQLKMGSVKTYAAVVALATNVVTVVTPIKEVFIARGAAATVIEDIQALIDALATVTGRRYTGLGTQIGKNVELLVAVRAAMEQMRILDGILSIVLKSSPGLLAEWKAAKRIPRGPQSVPAEGGSGSGTGTGTGSGTQPVVS